VSRRKLFALIAAFSMFAASCGGSGAAPTQIALIADTVSGGQINFGSLEGQDVVLWFWAPW